MRLKFCFGVKEKAVAPRFSFPCSKEEWNESVAVSLKMLFLFLVFCILLLLFLSFYYYYYIIIMTIFDILPARYIGLATFPVQFAIFKS
jgi:hypothetical protein